MKVKSPRSAPRLPSLPDAPSSVAAFIFLAAIAAFAFAPTAGQSPSPLGVSPEPASPEPASGSPVGSPSGAVATMPPGGRTPLPARLAEGTCAEPGTERSPLLGLVAGGDEGTVRPVYAAITVLEQDLASVREAGGVLIVGGEPGSPESAIACGELDAPAQGDADLAIALHAANDSRYHGTALFHERDGAVEVIVVVVAPEETAPDGSAAPEGSAQPAASGQPDASPDAGGSPSSSASAAPRPSVQPGTSGAPPFSPLPGGTEEP